MSLNVLLATALSLGLVHTLTGPDHYVPFIVLSRAEGWTLRRTLFWTALCGGVHVLSSIVVGALGIAFGWALNNMEGFEGLRGQVAIWALISFGALYFVWGLWRGRRGHSHPHVHADGSVHVHPHRHHEQLQPAVVHQHSDHDDQQHVVRHRRTRWALFLIFVLGPCEPLIPLLMVPASSHSVAGIATVAGVFGLATIGTMLSLVALSYWGLKAVRLHAAERYAHALAGATLVISGVFVKLFGV